MYGKEVSAAMCLHIKTVQKSTQSQACGILVSLGEIKLSLKISNYPADTNEGIKTGYSTADFGKIISKYNPKVKKQQIQ
jgi:hypothetical protein